MAYVDVIVAGQLSALFSLFRMEVQKILNRFPKLNERTDFVCFRICQISQVLCTLRGWIRHIGNQMHHRWLCDEGVSKLLDSIDQVYLPPTGNRIGPLRGQRGAQRPLCGVHGKRHLQVFWQIQTKRRQNS